eukprot:2847212-Amphidinium_carterae.1
MLCQDLDKSHPLPQPTVCIYLDPLPNANEMLGRNQSTDHPDRPWQQTCLLSKITSVLYMLMLEQSMLSWQLQQICSAQTTSPSRG